MNTSVGSPLFASVGPASPPGRSPRPTWVLDGETAENNHGHAVGAAENDNV